MASTGAPTSNIGLNQWLSSDKPERMDFNNDNLKIDTALGENKVEQDEIKGMIGDLSELETEDKSNLVHAMNEIKVTSSISPMTFEIPKEAWHLSGTHPGFAFEAVLSGYPRTSQPYRAKSSQK